MIIAGEKGLVLFKCYAIPLDIQYNEVSIINTT